jgi:RNase P subunit RPR2
VASYRLVERIKLPSDDDVKQPEPRMRVIGLARIARNRKTVLWSICTMRKLHHCDKCKVALVVGERAWRPITNGNDRMNRLCVSCVDCLK